jgi:hypothetical protein
MNPELLNRLLQGSFVSVILAEGTTLRGYVGADLGGPDCLRLDTMLLGETGNLEQVSLQLRPEDIAQVRFLPEAPVFVDQEGHDVRMGEGFFSD